MTVAVRTSTGTVHRRFLFLHQQPQFQPHQELAVAEVLHLEAVEEHYLAATRYLKAEYSVAAEKLVAEFWD
jgi:hypothetical protein